MMSARTVCFSHGKESGPQGTKIDFLAELARAAGWQTESLDYRGMDDPRERVVKLIDWCARQTQPYLLAGSSLGGHVATAAAVTQQPAGLFLLAPAFFMPGFEEHTPACPGCPVYIVHGRDDDTVPWQNSVRFAEHTESTVVLLDDDHRLVERLDDVGRHFKGFLQTVATAMEVQT